MNEMDSIVDEIAIVYKNYQYMEQSKVIEQD